MLTLQKTKELKGISIVLVMLFHLVTIHKTTLPYELRWVASFGVSVFLLVSGYGLFLSEKRNGLRDFFKKKIFICIHTICCCYIFNRGAK